MFFSCRDAIRGKCCAVGYLSHIRLQEMKEIVHDLSRDKVHESLWRLAFGHSQ